MALSPAQFPRFPTISALLGYLRCCDTTAVLDHGRAQLVREHTAERFGLSTTLTQEDTCSTRSIGWLSGSYAGG